MDPEAVMNLFDTCWFNHEILTKNLNVSAKTSKSELKYSSLRSILVRSQSEDMGSSFNYGSFSPNSVLKPMPSGKLDFATQKQDHQQEQVEEDQESETAKKDDQMEMMKKKKKKKIRPSGTSKSLSELEFEELKGFMDMGFVFSEQDKDSSLVEIIPGLQRLGGGGGGDGDDDDGSGGGERRPYLSEAWEDMDRKLLKKEHKRAQPLMKWEIPAVRDEVDMKDNLKLWAHTVASFVR